MFTRLLVCALALAASPALVGAEADMHAAAAMTILRAHCFGCHNVEKKRGQLDLTSRDAALKGGETGPALKPGKASDSPLVKLLAPGVESHMPPKKQLPPQLIATLRAWVDAGAPWDAGVLKLLTRETKSDELKALPATYTPVLAVALAPDGKRLASARGNQLLIHTLGATNRTLVATLTGARDAINPSRGAQTAAGWQQASSAVCCSSMQRRSNRSARSTSRSPVAPPPSRSRRTAAHSRSRTARAVRRDKFTCGRWARKSPSPRGPRTTTASLT